MRKKQEFKTRTSSTKTIETHGKIRASKAAEVSGGCAQPRCPQGSSGAVDVLESKTFPIIPVIISFVTWILRVNYVTNRNNWVSIHPDEVFQTMEAAHIELYGYGFRPYEFSSSFEDDAMNVNATQYRQMELDAGLSSLRSPIPLCYYILFAKIASFIGVDANPYLIFRLAHVTISSLLPMSVYFYTKTMFYSTLVAIIAAVFTSCSIHLNVIGTHCFLQSFLSPIIFLTLALVNSLVNVDVPKTDISTCKNVDSAHDGRLCGTSDKKNMFRDNQMLKSVQKGVRALSAQDLVSSISKSQFDHRPILPQISNWCVSDKKQGDIMKFSLINRATFAGFFTGMSCYIRPDTVLVFFVNLCFVLSSSSKRRQMLSQAPLIFFGFLISALISFMMDTQFYGGITISPWNWFLVNIVRNISTSLFGRMDFWFYFTTLYSRDSLICGIFILSLAISTALTSVHVFQKIFKKEIILQQNSLKNHNKATGSPLFIFIACIFLLVSYSVHGHKEVRFIHDTVVFVIIFSACILCKTLSLVNIDYERKTSKAKFVVVLVIIWMFQWHQFCSHSSTTQWSFHHAPDTQYTNTCLEFISKQHDVSGVFLEDNIFLTGGMTVLHKDVPIFSRVMNGYFEFAMDARINTTSGLGALVKKRDFSVNTFTRLSNYVSQTNNRGVLCNVLEKQEYNYFVLTKDQPFKKMGFQQVFENGNRKVLKRVGDPVSEGRINYALDRLTLGDDPKVLIHEGDVLFHMRQFQRAAERFQHAVKISPTRDGAIDAYLPLHESLKELGRHEDAQRVIQQCSEIHGHDKCWTPRRMTRLYA